MNKLNILWTTDNKATVINMLSMYALNSKRKGWWQEVNIILWGASVPFVASDTQVQTEILEMLQIGIHVEACKDCCDIYGVTSQIEKLGIEVHYMGEPFTRYIKSGEALITI